MKKHPKRTRILRAKELMSRTNVHRSSSAKFRNRNAVVGNNYSPFDMTLLTRLVRGHH